MKHNKIIIPTILFAGLVFGAGAVLLQNDFIKVEATGPTYSYISSTQTIYLKDNTEDEIREYYSSLNSLSESERKGTNILKNLKPILQDFNYYSYDNVWKIYEITDREWELSPASETTYGTYDADTNTINNYQYGSSSDPKNDPYVHTLYRNRDENGITIESGRIKEWGNHSGKNNATNREHVWCQSRGFKYPGSGAAGPAGTDIHHLISGDAYVNQDPHNNNPYGYVNPNSITINSADAQAYCAGNIAGAPLNTHSEDESTVVFEPQDSDKGDIARACFYMVACYNNLSGTDTITQYNPNLTLADYATSSGSSEISDADNAVAMGILSDLLEWHKLDPVDEYEKHRNNLIFNNYQHNRNPFIDFPQWVDYIWGGVDTAISPSTDAVYGSSTSVSVTGVSLDESEVSVSVGNTKELTATITPSNATNKTVKWTSSDTSIATVSGGTVTGVSAGSATITVTTDDGGYSATCQITVNEPITITPISTIVNLLNNGTYNNSEYTIKGTVTGVYGSTFYLQEGAYAICVYNYGLENVAVGKVVQLTSTFQIYKSGVYETKTISSASIIDEEPETISPVLIHNISELTSTMQNSVVSFTGLTYSSGTYEEIYTSAYSIEFNLGSDKVVYRTNQYLDENTQITIRNKIQQVIASKDTATFNLIGVQYTVYYETKQFVLYSPDQIVIVPNDATDKELVQTFVDDYMHMSDYTGEGTGLCLGADGYYMKAKKALTVMTSDQIALFQDDSDFDEAQARYEAWAAAYGDTTPYSTSVNLAHNLKVIENDETIMMSIIIALSTISLVGFIILLTKRKKKYN